MRRAIIVCFFVLLSGCAYTAQLADQPVTTTAMPVASPLSRPLLLVVSPSAVPSELPIEDSKHTLAGFNAFVGASLKDALAPYFSGVEVVASTDGAPAGSHYVADVAVTRVIAKPLTAGDLTYTTIVMEWSFGLRLSEATDYVFSAVAESASEMQYRTLDLGAQQMMKAAISALQGAWADKEVLARLRALESGPVTPAPQPQQPQPEQPVQDI